MLAVEAPIRTLLAALPVEEAEAAEAAEADEEPAELADSLAEPGMSVSMPRTHRSNRIR